MVLELRLVLIVVGLLLWLIPWRPEQAKLSDVGKCTYCIALLTYLWK